MKGKTLLSLGGIMMLIVIFIIPYNYHFLRKSDSTLLISSRAFQLSGMYDNK